MPKAIQQPARQLPQDVLQGFERRALTNAVPAAKLPEIIELRAIVRELLGHIAFLDQQLQGVATV